jgi:hypothetical protein
MNGGPGEMDEKRLIVNIYAALIQQVLNKVMYTE